MASTYGPLVIGALLAAAGSLTYILRTKAFSDAEPSGEPGSTRQQAVRAVLAVYALIAWISFVIAVAFGDLGFIALTALITLIATLGAMAQWLRGAGTTSPACTSRQIDRIAKGEQPKRMRVRITYVALAVAAFSLSLVAGDVVPIATCSFLLVVSLLGAAIATRQERQEG